MTHHDCWWNYRIYAARRQAQEAADLIDKGLVYKGREQLSGALRKLEVLQKAAECETDLARMRADSEC